MNKPGTQQLETHRLILRRFRAEDAEDMFGNWSFTCSGAGLYGYECYCQYAGRDILMQVNTFDRRKLDIMRKYLDGVRRVKLDASGRLQIPKDLLDRSELTKDIVIDSMFTNMEIWDKAKYEERVNAISTDELAQGIEDLFSNLNF